jgi:hypothetical protein
MCLLLAHRVNSPRSFSATAPVPLLVDPMALRGIMGTLSVSVIAIRTRVG